MRRQLATSADNLSTQYPHNVLKKSPPKDHFLNPPIPDGQRGRLSPPPPVSPPSVSPPRQRITSPAKPHPVLLPSISSPSLASPTATGGSGGPASPSSPTAVVDLPSPGQLAQILVPQVRVQR